MVFTTDDLHFFLANYCEEKGTFYNVTNVNEENYNWWMEVIVGDDLTDGFYIIASRPESYKGTVNYKEDKMDQLPDYSLVRASVHSAIFPPEEMTPEGALKIAEQVEKDLNYRVIPQPGSMHLKDARMLEPAEFSFQDKSMAGLTIIVRREGEVDGTNYLSPASTIGELRKAITAIQECRSRHMERFTLLDKMKTMPYWEDYLAERYE